MTGKLSQWIQRKIQQRTVRTDDLKRDQQGRIIPPLPVLQAIPASRGKQAEVLRDGTKVTANSPFFQRLPPDIRRMILIEAFGDRIMHVGLRLCPGRRGGRHRDNSAAPDLDWQWYGCVCHRDPEWRVRGKRVGETSTSPPSKDQCVRHLDHLHADAHACGDWSGEKPLKCRVGAMGWMRTCRQAYVEGIQVLYGTNGFNFSSMDLLKNLSQLLKADHLTLLSAAEMTWDLGGIIQPPDPEQHASTDARFSGWFTFLDLLQSIPTALPHLRFLHITLNGNWYPGKSIYEVPRADVFKLVETVILQPLDETIRAYFLANPRLEKVIVGLPWSIFAKVDMSGLWPGQKDFHFGLREPGEEGISIRLWRPVECDIDSSSHPNRNPGYWCTEGTFDQDMCSHCAGPISWIGDI